MTTRRLVRSFCKSRTRILIATLSGNGSHLFSNALSLSAPPLHVYKNVAGCFLFTHILLRIRPLPCPPLPESTTPNKRFNDPEEKPLGLYKKTCLNTTFHPVSKVCPATPRSFIAGRHVFPVLSRLNDPQDDTPF